MKQIKKIVFYILIGLLVLGILYFGFGIINTMVSMKYETDKTTDCISFVTGKDLCLAIKFFQGLTVVCIVAIIVLIVFRKRFLRIP